VQKRSEITTSDGDDKDKLKALYGPEGSQPHPMLADLDIGSVAGNIGHMLAELERDLPELALHRLREQGNLTAPGVRAGYSDAIDRIVEAQGNYDAALVRAQQMAVSIGGYNSYRGFEAFDLGSYDKGDLEHFIATRPVIEDALALNDRLTFLIKSKAPSSAVWTEMDVPEDQQKTWQKEIDQRREDFMDRLDQEDDPRESFNPNGTDRKPETDGARPDGDVP